MVSEKKSTDHSAVEGRNPELTKAVSDALENLDFVRENDLNLHIHAANGTVTISGVVLSRLMKRAVLQAVQRVPDVQQVIDLLYTDTDLTLAVSKALSVDPTTKQHHEIRVTSERGQITLSGEVTDAKLIDAATKLASEVPSVREVVNDLTLVKTSMMDENIARSTAGTKD